MKYSEKMSDSYKLFEMLASSFSMTGYSKNDFFLVLKCIDVLSTGETFSIEKMSELTGVSTATISRFVKKYGFKNYYQFRAKLYAIHEAAKYERLINYEKDKKAENFDTILCNLKKTQENLDIDSINEILHTFLESKESYIVGAAADMTCFSGFWKDLVANGVAARFFYDFSVQTYFLNTAEAGNCFLLLTVDNQYVNYYEEYLLTAKKRGASLILLTQNEEDVFSKMFDLVYRYGEPRTSNYGRYSLQYLDSIFSNQVLCLYENK